MRERTLLCYTRSFDAGAIVVALSRPELSGGVRLLVHCSCWRGASATTLRAMNTRVHRVGANGTLEHQTGIGRFEPTSLAARCEIHAMK